MLQTPRVAIVGIGLVGSTTAYALLMSGLTAEIVLVDRDRRRAEGHVHDLRDAEVISHNTRVVFGEQYRASVVTTPAHQVDAVPPALQRSKAQWVQFMSVTFEPERLRDAIGSHRCSFGMPSAFMMATMDSEAGSSQPSSAA